MSRQVYQSSITLTTSFQPLAAARTELAVATVSAPPTNAGNVIFEGVGGQEVPWVPGEWCTFVEVDLSTIRVKGAAGDVVTINGSA